MVFVNRPCVYGPKGMTFGLIITWPVHDSLLSAIVIRIVLEGVPHGTYSKTRYQSICIKESINVVIKICDLFLIIRHTNCTIFHHFLMF